MKKEDQGDFYVHEDECVICGCCERVAPALFSSDDTVSFVKSQPNNIDEMRRMFRASRICMVECIYYEGSDKLLKTHFENIKSCFERNGNICSLDYCSCFDSFMKTQSSIK